MSRKCRLPDSSVAKWQARIDKMRRNGISSGPQMVMYERGAIIARRIDQLDFAAGHVAMGADGFIESDVHLLCEACGCDKHLVPVDGDSDTRCICPRCGIDHCSLGDARDFSSFLAKEEWHYGAPDQFLPPLDAAERIASIVRANLSGEPTWPSRPTLQR